MMLLLLSWKITNNNCVSACQNRLRSDYPFISKSFIAGFWVIFILFCLLIFAFIYWYSRQLTRLNNMPVVGSSLKWTVPPYVGLTKAKPTGGTDRPQPTTVVVPKKKKNIGVVVNHWGSMSFHWVIQFIGNLNPQRTFCEIAQSLYWLSVI